MDVVFVTLKNPPTGANQWQMLVTDFDRLQSRTWGAEQAHDNISYEAFFDVTGFEIPLFLMLSINKEWQDEKGEWRAIELYTVQSIIPTAPNYKKITIPDYGRFTFDCLTEQIEEQPSEEPELPPPVGWRKIGVSIIRTITTLIPEPVGWRKIGVSIVRTITTLIPEAVGWRKIGVSIIRTITVAEAPPPPSPPPPPEEEVSWLPAALVVGGVVVTAIALAKPKTKKT